MKISFKRILMVIGVVGVAGCTATANMNMIPENVKLKVNQDSEVTVSKTIQQKYYTTSFGQYKFKVTAEGHEPMYGLIPQKFNGGYLALDILFFAPAMFFNLREVYPYYEFDIEHNEVRYRKDESKPWRIYKPSASEIEHAKKYFGEIAK